MISSSSNSQIKNVCHLIKKSKVRKEQNAFVVEGIKIYSETPAERLIMTYVSQKFLESATNSKLLKGRKYEVVANDVFTKISDTVTPQGILAIVKKDEQNIEKMLESKNGRMFIILEDLQDPGNLGTIIRTAEGAGVAGIIMTSNTVDIYNPKVIRSTMGGIYRVPFLYTDRLDETIKSLKKSGVTVVASHLNGKNNFYEENYKGNVAFIIGNEANGISDETSKMADLLVRIPMCGSVESLNASVAASILMYEAYRQQHI